MNNNYILTSNGELYHYGIKGQKWGVRRYQNKDGSLTPAGKKRLAKNERELDQLNARLFKNRFNVQRIQSTMQDDPGAVMASSVFIKDINDDVAKGKTIVERMKKKGLVSNDTTFNDYTAKYERKVMDDCKQWVNDRYSFKITDDDVGYFLLQYLYRKN